MNLSGFANYVVRFCQLQPPVLSGFENYAANADAEFDITASDA